MNNCGPICILFIWIGFFWPVIVSGFYLVIKREQITSKGKYFLLSTFGGYVLFIGFNFLISYLARNFLEINSEEEMNTLVLITAIMLFIPPIIFSYVLSKRTANKTLERNSWPCGCNYFSSQTLGERWINWNLKT